MKARVFSPPGGKSGLAGKASGGGGGGGGVGSVAGSDGGGAPGGGKPVSMAEVVKQARAGKSSDAEDGLVMETKLKIIEILQVRRTMMKDGGEEMMSIWLMVGESCG